MQVIAGETGEVECELPVGDFAYKRMAWHPGGLLLAVWDSQEGVSLWDVKTRTKKLVFPHLGMPSQLRFNNDGTLLISLSLWNERLLIWEVGGGQRMLEVTGFTQGACDAAGDGRILFLQESSEDLNLTELAGGACRALANAIHPPLAYWYNVSIGPEGRILAVSSERGVELWDLATTQRLVAATLGRCMAEFDDAGRLIVGCTKGIYRWPRRVELAPTSLDESAGTSKPAGATSIVRFGPPERIGNGIEPASLSANARGESLLFRDSSGWAIAHLEGRGAKVRLQVKDDPRRSALSNDNRHAAIANWESGGVGIWDAASGAAFGRSGRGTARCRAIQPRWPLPGSHARRRYLVEHQRLAKRRSVAGTWHDADGLGHRFFPR